MTNTKKILSVIGFVLLIINAKAQFVENPTGTLTSEDRVVINSNGTLGGTFNPSTATLNIGTGGVRLLLDNNEIYGNNALYFGSAYDRGIYFRNVDNNGSEDLMALTSNGNLGLGTTTPGTRLHILGASNTLKISKGTGYSPIQFYSDGDGTHNNSPISIYSYGSGGTQDLNFYIQNWGGSYKFRMGASGGAYNIATITKGGTASNGPDATYGVFNVLGLNQATSIRLNGGGDSYFTGGEVGIGTSSPSSASLHIYRNATTGGWGSVSHANAGLRIQDSGASLYIDGNSLYTTTTMNIGTTGNNHFAIGTKNIERLRVDENGNVGIGTTNTHGYKLAVEGQILSEEVKVALSTNWPDYVFTPSYDLKSLDQVETFINENGHLPNIPSAQEVEENNGIELGEMNAKLLEKIEELTLHLIEKDKENKKQDQLIQMLIERIEKLENQ